LAIVSFDVIEHLEKYEEYVENILKLLKPDGMLIIGCPNRLELFNWNKEWNPFHFQEFSPYQMKRLLTKYFDEVKMGGQDFVSQDKREILRKMNLGLYREEIRKKRPFFLIRPFVNKRNYLPEHLKIKLSHEDISIKMEPGEDILNKSFGIVAVAKQPKANL